MFGFGKKKQRAFVSAVIPAAGTSSRMEGINKQQVSLEGTPTIVWTLDIFSRLTRIDEIILVCPPSAIPDYFSLVQEFGLHKVASVVGGGDTRQESVFRGIRACSSQAEYYVIHDGARPLVEEETIHACLDAAFVHGAAAVGVPLKDTVKIVDENGFIISTPNREKLRAIQTPQIFQAELYQAAMAKAESEGRFYTDDCQLVEQMGRSVWVSPGSYDNIKITTPDDLVSAATILRYREEGLDPWIFE